MTIRTVGIVGTGVIGASWTGLFLAHGLHVYVADPAPGAAEKLAAYLEAIWPTMELMGLEEKYVLNLNPSLRRTLTLSLLLVLLFRIMNLLAQVLTNSTKR